MPISDEGTQSLQEARRAAVGLAKPFDPTVAWTYGAVARAQPVLVGNISRQMEPFSRGQLQMESFVAPGATKDENNDDANAAPDAVRRLVLHSAFVRPNIRFSKPECMILS